MRPKQLGKQHICECISAFVLKLSKRVGKVKVFGVRMHGMTPVAVAVDSRHQEFSGCLGNFVMSHRFAILSL